MQSIRILMQGLVDYAGLFPPARLDMAPAVRQYATHREHETAWMLGRFVLPAARLEEFETAAAGVLPRGAGAAPWRLSALVGDDVAADAARIEAFNRRHADPAAGAAVIDTVEIRATTPAAIDAAVRALPRTLDVYVEIPIAEDPAPLVAAIARAGARAKVRTGGITPELFPTAAQLARFLRACAAAGVLFKATAGLHHPIRAVYRLTYEPDAPTGTMFGFLNVFLAAAFLRAGMSEADAVALLEETSAAAIHFDDAGVTWRGHRLDVARLAAARDGFATAFGSCSFQEPLDDLLALNLLQSSS